MDLPTEVTMALLTSRSWEPKRRRSIRQAFASHQERSSRLVQAVARLARRLVKRGQSLTPQPAGQASAAGRVQA